MDVHDRDGGVRTLPEDEVEALERVGKALTCPNDEDDLSAGYHAHIHTTWDEYDTQLKCDERHPGQSHDDWAEDARAYVEDVTTGVNMGFGSVTKAIEASEHLALLT